MFRSHKKSNQPSVYYDQPPLLAEEESAALQKTFVECRQALNTKRPEELESEYQKVGYLTRSFDCRFFYQPALAVIERLQFVSPGQVIPEIHYLCTDLSDYLAYSQHQWQLFMPIKNKRPALSAFFEQQQQKDEIKPIANYLKKLLQVTANVHDSLLENIRRPQRVCETLRQLHSSCDLCQFVFENGKIERGQQLDTPFVEVAHESHLSQIVLPDNTPTRQMQIDLGIQSCRAIQQLLLQNNQGEFTQHLLSHNAVCWKTLKHLSSLS